MPNESVAEVGHPLVDYGGTGPDGLRWVATESRAPVIHLSPLRVNLVAAAAAEGQRVALVTDELCCLTRGFAHVWRRAGAAWVVKDSAGGMRDGFAGRVLPTIADAWSRTGAEVAVRSLRPQRVDTLQVTTTVSQRHPARESVRLGGAVEALGEIDGAAAPREWGPFEPVSEPWDRRALTELVREQMPAETAVLVTGDRLAATVSAQRTVHGVEEVTHAAVALPPSTERGFDATRARLDAMLGRLAQQAMPLVALVLARPGRRDLLVPPFLGGSPIPLTLLIGAAAVRSFDLDPAATAARFGGQVVGRPRLPALLFPLGAYEPGAWRRLDEIVGALDGQRLPEALGPIARLLWADRPAGAGAPGAP